MFEALVNAVLFNNIVKGSKDLITDVNIHASHAGLVYQCLDNSHVAMVHLIMPAEAFDHYRCDQATTLGVNMASLSKLMTAGVGDDSSLTLTNDPANPDVLGMQFENAKQTRISRFDLKLIDIDAENMGIPEVEYPVNVSMPSSEFVRIIKELSAIGDTISIAATKEGVKFSVVGDKATGTIVCRPTSDDVDLDEKAKAERVEIKVSAEFTLLFSARYLKDFGKGSVVNDRVTIRMDDNVPLVVEYMLPENNGRLRFYLAPKIEDGNAAEKAAAAVAAGGADDAEHGADADGAAPAAAAAQPNPAQKNKKQAVKMETEI